jgi:hypothetical protein
LSAAKKALLPAGKRVDSHSPGLGKSKELQISHHLCVTLDVLNGVI